MYPRRPLSYAQQIDRMRRRVRRLQTLLNHRYADFFELTKGRTDCPFEVNVLSRLVDSTREAAGLAEACLQELRRQEALFYAPFKPGDCVSVVFEGARGEKRTEFMLVTDVKPGKRSGDFYYEVLTLTKAGTISKRSWTHPLNSRWEIQRAEYRLNEEGQRYAEYYRESAKVSRVLAFERGDLTMFEPVRDYLGIASYRRVDRLTA